MGILIYFWGQCVLGQLIGQQMATFIKCLRNGLAKKQKTKSKRKRKKKEIFLCFDSVINSASGSLL